MNDLNNNIAASATSNDAKHDGINNAKHDTISNINENVSRARRVIAKYPIKFPPGEIFPSGKLIDPLLIESIVACESNYNEYAIRLEQNFYHKYCRKFSFKQVKVYNPRIVTIIDSEIYKGLMAWSWGPLQIMGLVAHECGFVGDVRQLLDMETGLRWGIKKMELIAKRKGYGIDDLISAYNDGDDYHPRDNVKYVEKVKGYYESLIASR